MKGKQWFILLASMVVVLLASSVGVTRSSFVDLETSIGNTFQAWASSKWVQTSQTDFEAGVLSQVDTSSTPGDVKLASEESKYVSSGISASQVLDTGVAGANWDALFWDETVEGGTTNITFEVRASNASFAKGDASPSWTSVGGTSPVTSGLPSGRYMQWRATLTTSDTSKTPILHEVTIYHY